MDQTGSGNNRTTTSGVQTATARVVDDAASRAHDTIDKAAAKAQPAVDRMATNAHDLVERAAVKASDAAEGVDSKVDDLRETGLRLSEQCENYVQDNPLKAVGIALAAGFILAKLF